MDEFDVIARIEELREKYHWSYYRLALESGIAYSTLSTMLHKAHLPSIPSLLKLCGGFGIGVGEFFDAGSGKEEEVSLSREQKTFLERWDALDEQSKRLAMAYMEGLADRQDPEEDKKQAPKQAMKPEMKVTLYPDR